MKNKNVGKYFSKLDFFVNLIVSFLFTVSPFYQKSNNYCLTFNTSLLLVFLMYFVFFAIGTILARMLIEKIALNDKEIKLIKLFNSKYSIFFIAIILLICWLPFLICLYPGTLNNDGWGQIFFVKNNLYVDQHPLLDTLIIGGIILKVSSLSNGNWHLAIFVLTCIQAVAMSFALAHTLTYSKKKLNLNTKLLFFVLLLYGIFPIFPYTVQAVSKDTLFSCVYVLFFVNYLEIIRTKAENLKCLKSLVYTIILSILCAFTKRIGIYIVVGSLFFVLCTHFKVAWKSIGVILLSVFGFITILNVINNNFSIFYIISGGQEGKYSLLFQQTARYAKYYDNEVTENEKKSINRVLKYDWIAYRYNSRNSDNLIICHVKGHNNSVYIDYLKTWVQQGLKHPKVYIDAGFAMMSGWFSQNEFRPLMDMDWHDQLDESLIPEWVTKRPNEISTVANWLKDKYDELYKLPLFNIILSFGFIASIIPAFAFTTSIKYNKNIEKRRLWLGSFPTIISVVLGCWMGPVSDITEGIRYLYPIVFTNIMLLLWCVYCAKQCKRS